MDAAAESFDKEDTRPLRVYFQDEARFGRMQNPVSCWATEGFHPHVKLQKKYFRNGFWLTMDELENDLINALIEVSKSKETIQNLVGFHWTIF